METRMIAVPSRTKEILDRYGLRAKKGFGQNFLVDPVIVTRCAEMSHPDGAVIEIGPGIGSLTEALAKNAQHVIAYEIDAGLIPVLQDTLAPYDNVEIILQDFLECDVADQVKRLKEEYGQVTVCANLPYYITTPVLLCQAGKDRLVRLEGQDAFDRACDKVTLIRFPESRHEIYNATDEIREPYFKAVISYFDAYAGKK